MVSKKLAIDVLNEALATGADYAEIFYEDSHSYSLSIENGKVETSSSNIMNGVGLRLLKGNQCGTRGTSCVDQLAIAIEHALIEAKAS